MKDKEIIVVAFGCQYIDKPIEGSYIMNCDECHTEVWIAPSWQGKKIDKTLCMKCYNKNVGTDSYKGANAIVDIAITEEQIREFNDSLTKKYGYTMTNEEIITMLENELGRKVILMERAEDKTKRSKDKIKRKHI